jgi:hypothetical protein
MARSVRPVSAVTAWSAFIRIAVRCPWAIGVLRAPTGSVSHPSPKLPLSSRTWEMAPTAIPARSPSAQPWCPQSNTTYQILDNDAVAKTGGQPVEGRLSVSRIVQQVRAEGASRVVVLSEDAGRFEHGDPLPLPTELYGRDEHGRIQEALRTQPGVSVIIFDQVCCRREATAAQDQGACGSGPASLHQRSGVRGLRRLLRAVELSAPRRHGAQQGDERRVRCDSGTCSA